MLAPSLRLPTRVVLSMLGVFLLLIMFVLSPGYLVGSTIAFKIRVALIGEFCFIQLVIVDSTAL